VEDLDEYDWRPPISQGLSIARQLQWDNDELGFPTGGSGGGYRVIVRPPHPRPRVFIGSDDELAIAGVEFGLEPEYWQQPQIIVYTFNRQPAIDQDEISIPVPPFGLDEHYWLGKQIISPLPRARVLLGDDSFSPFGDEDSYWGGPHYLPLTRNRQPFIDQDEISIPVPPFGLDKDYWTYSISRAFVPPLLPCIDQDELFFTPITFGLDEAAETNWAWITIDYPRNRQPITADTDNWFPASTNPFGGYGRVVVKPNPSRPILFLESEDELAIAGGGEMPGETSTMIAGFGRRKMVRIFRGG
jgi:hypothetical protein